MLGTFIKAIVADAFGTIFFSLVPTFLIWFFGSVVFQLINADPLRIWGVIYLILMIFFIAYEALIRIGATYFIFRQCRRLELSFDEVYTAIVELKLQKKLAVPYWSAKWVRQQIVADMMAKKLAQALKDSM